MNEDKMRKEFEAELGKQLGYKPDGLGFATNKDGTYLQFAVNQRWELWQAATRAAVPAWQPIEAAPRHGRELILLLTPSKFPQVAYSNSWHTCGFSFESKPTHYMPIPPAPEVKP